MQPNTLLATISPFDPAKLSTQTIYLSSAGRGAVALNNVQWLPAILQAPTFSYGIDPAQGSATKDNSSSLGQLEASYGTLTIGCVEDWGTDGWANYEFDGAPITFYAGIAGQPFESYTHYWTGLCGALETSSLSQVGAIALRGNELALTKPILTATYDGLGGAGGEDGMSGNPKPWTSGLADNMQPVLINTAYQVYQAHGFGPISDVSAVYENALILDQPVTNVCNSYDDLVALDLQAGQWAKANAVGMFRLGSDPVGTITCDIAGALDTTSNTFPQTVGAIVGHIMKAQGGLTDDAIDAVSLASLDTRFNHGFSTVITSDTNVGDFCRDTLAQVNAYMLSGTSGKWIFGRNVDGGVQTTLDSTNKADPRVIDYFRVAQTISRVWSVTVNAAPVWYVNSTDEVSDAVKAAQLTATDANANSIAAIAAATSATTDTATMARELPALVLPLLQDPINQLSALNIQSSGSTATAISGLAASTAAGMNTITARIEEVQTLSTDNNQARVSDIKTVQASIDDTTATVQENTTAIVGLDGTLNASWTLKVQTESDGTAVVGGMGIATDDGKVDVAFSTDSFRIYTDGGNHQVFYADDSGITMPNVTIDTLKAGSVTIDGIAAGLTDLTTFTANDVMIDSTEGTLIETPSFMLGDTVSGNGMATISFLQDSLSTRDTFVRFRVYVDYGDGSGYVLKRDRTEGIQTLSGSTYWAKSVSFPLLMSSSNPVKVKVTATGVEVNGNGVTSGSYARNIEIDVLKLAR